MTDVQTDTERKPACRLILSNEQIAADRETWKQQRRRDPDTGQWRLTASDMAGVAGLAPPKQSSALKVYIEKTTGVDSFAGNARTRFGTWAEPMVDEAFSEQHPELYVVDGGLYVSATHPWLGATFDRIAYLNDAAGDYGEPFAPVQIKTWHSRSDFGAAGSDDMPLHLQIQLLIEMHVLGTDVAYEPVMFWGIDEPVTFELHRDAQAQRDIGRLLDVGERFIARLENEDEPEADWSPATADALKARYRKYEDREVRLPGGSSTSGLARRRAAAAAAKDKADKRLQLVNNLIRQAMGDAATAVAYDPITGTDRVVVTRSGYPRREYTVPANDWIETMRAGEWGKPPKQRKSR